MGSYLLWEYSLMVKHNLYWDIGSSPIILKNIIEGKEKWTENKQEPK